MADAQYRLWIEAAQEQDKRRPLDPSWQHEFREAALRRLAAKVEPRRQILDLQGRTFDCAACGTPLVIGTGNACIACGGTGHALTIAEIASLATPEQQRTNRGMREAL